MKALDALVFDFDGLIMDTESAEYESIVEVFSAHGEVLSFDLWQSFIGTTDHPHWCDILEAQLGRAVDRERLVAGRRRRHLAAVDRLDLNPGVIQLLDEADRADLVLGVASSSSRRWVHAHLTRHGLLGRFAALANGDEVPLTKPDPAVYRLALDRLGVEARRACAIEDSVNGCRAAIAAGLTVVAVPSPMTRSMDFSFAHLVVESLADLSPDRLDALVASRHS